MKELTRAKPRRQALRLEIYRVDVIPVIQNALDAASKFLRNRHVSRPLDSPRLGICALPLHESGEGRCHVLQLGPVQSGIDPDKERVPHDEIRIAEVAHDPVLDGLEGRMP